MQNMASSPMRTELRPRCREAHRLGAPGPGSTPPSLSRRARNLLSPSRPLSLSVSLYFIFLSLVFSLSLSLSLSLFLSGSLSLSLSLSLAVKTLQIRVQGSGARV